MMIGEAFSSEMLVHLSFTCTECISSAQFPVFLILFILFLLCTSTCLIYLVGKEHASAMFVHFVVVKNN